MILRNLVVLSNAGNFTMYHYSSTLPINDIEVPHFFNDASYKLKVGDVIIVSAHNSSAMLTVSKNIEGNVSTVRTGNSF